MGEVEIYGFATTNRMERLWCALDKEDTIKAFRIFILKERYITRKWRRKICEHSIVSHRATVDHLVIPLLRKYTLL